MFQTTNQIIVIITIIIIISTNCARLLERIPQQKINNQIRSMSKKQTSINNKNITLKTNSFPSQKLPKSLPLRWNTFSETADLKRRQKWCCSRESSAMSSEHVEAKGWIPTNCWNIEGCRFPHPTQTLRFEHVPSFSDIFLDFPGGSVPWPAPDTAKWIGRINWTNSLHYSSAENVWSCRTYHRLRISSPCLGNDL